MATLFVLMFPVEYFMEVHNTFLNLTAYNPKLPGGETGERGKRGEGERRWGGGGEGGGE